MMGKKIRKGAGWLLCLLMIAALLIPAMASADSLKAPKLSSVKIVKAGVKFSWKSVKGADSYRVYRKVADGEWKTLAETSGTAYTDGSVENDKTYSYSVCCLDADGEKVSSYSKKGLTIKFVSSSTYKEPELKSAKLSGNGVKFSWKSVSGASQYQVLRKTASTDWKVVGVTSKTSYQDDAVTSGVRYTYTVRAEGGKKAASSYNKTGRSITFYSRPVMKSTKSVAEGVKIQWSSVPGAPYYAVMRKAKSSSKPYIQIAVVKGTSYTDTRMGADRIYLYKVVVLGADQKTKVSGTSASITGQFRGTVAVNSLTNEKGGVLIKWNAVSGASEYWVYRRFGEGTWRRIGKTDSTSLKDSETQNNVTYFYRVKAVNKRGTSVCSYSKEGKSITYFVAPTLLNCERSGSGLKVSWEAVEGVGYYAVLRKIGDGGWTLMGTTANTSFTDDTIPSATWGLYTVRCADINGNYVSGYDSIGVGETSYSDTPVMTGAANGNGYITVSWRSVDVAKYYNVYKRTGERTSWTLIGKGISGTSFDDPAVENGGTYTYAVSVATKSGEDMSLHDSAGLTTTYYGMPRKLAVSNASTGVRFTWGKVDGIGVYQIYRKTGNAPWTKIGTAYTNSYTDTTVENNAHYVYTVSCLKNGEEVSASSQSGVGILFHSAPLITAVTNGNGVINVSWNTVDGIGSYRLYRKEGTGGWAQVTDQSAVTYTDSKVVSGVKYTYKVVCLENGKVVSSNRNEMSVTYLRAPSVSTSHVTGGTKVKWGKVAGATEYEIYRKTALTGWTKLNTVGDVSEYLDGDGVVNTVYYYYVVAVRKDGSRSAGSAVVKRLFAK